ncbi:MAG: hypothetical protein KDH96_00905 [Candidatus Riesia sp.]|nr:hypothetical protein [Candidatus Riesia sp.]
MKLLFSIILLISLSGCMKTNNAELNPKYFPHKSYSNGISMPRYYSQNNKVIDRCELLYAHPELYYNVDLECKRKLYQLAHTYEPVEDNTITYK